MVEVLKHLLSMFCHDLFEGRGINVWQLAPLRVGHQINLLENKLGIACTVRKYPGDQLGSALTDSHHQSCVSACSVRRLKNMELGVFLLGSKVLKGLNFYAPTAITGNLF